MTAGTGSTFTACASPFGGGFTVTQPQGWTTTLAPLTTGDTTNGVEMVFSLPNGGVRIASVLPCSFELTGTQTDLDPVTPTRTPDLFSLNGLNINGTVTGLRVANAVGCGTLRDGDLARIQANYAFDTGISGRVTP